MSTRKHVTNEPVTSIRTGDTVTDRHGRTYVAESDCLWVRETLAYNVLADGRWVEYFEGETVLSLDYTEEDEPAYV